MLPFTLGGSHIFNVPNYQTKTVSQLLKLDSKDVEPKIGVFSPQNGWFIMENPMNKWMIWGVLPPLFLVQHLFVATWVP